MGPRGPVGLPRGPRGLRRRRHGGVREGGGGGRGRGLVPLIVQGPGLVRTDADVEIEGVEGTGAALRVVGLAIVGIHLRGSRSNGADRQDP